MKYLAASVASVMASLQVCADLYYMTALQDRDLIVLSLAAGVAVGIAVYSLLTPPRKKKKKAVYVTLEPSYKLVGDDGSTVMAKL